VPGRCHSVVTEWAERLHRRGGGVPYGVALAAAALFVYPQTEWMAAVGF